ncbi:MAG: hypothetical protein GX159_07750 [Flavobacteriaceae bacterium]|jgi:hypothetical protein|nr:hypothetical protein [Flavobacteriaceae bacterium]
MKDIKAENLFFVSGNSKSFVLLCLFVFSASLSAQIFQSNNTEIFIVDETVVTQNFSQIQKTDSAHIYIVTGTTVTGLHSDQNIAVIYLEKPEETKTHLAEKYSEQEKKVAEHTPSETKAILPKETFKQNDRQKRSFFSAYHSTAVAPTSVQDIKLIDFPPEEIKYVHHKATSQKLIFEKENLLLLSVCLTVNKIRPPPFV